MPCRYGVGVGGEYVMASTSASERAAKSPGMQRGRGRHVLLVFSGQGLGTFTDSCVILLGYLFFGQLGTCAVPGTASCELTRYGARAIISLQYAVATLVTIASMTWRFTCLQESQMYKEEDKLEHDAFANISFWNRNVKTLKYWGWRQIVTSIGWFINDFAFYGNKLSQTMFIKLIHPQESNVPWLIQRWTVLNAFVALVGYYMAAWLIDYKWYGRCRMQYIGFFAVFIFNIIIFGQWYPLHGSYAGGQGLQFLYYMSSFFQQLGPNTTTWLVAGEVYPTDIRASHHGFSAATGKFGAIMATLWLSYVGHKRWVFFIGAMWSLAGGILTVVMLPDTTGLELQELDRMQRYILEGRFHEYVGAGVSRPYLSLWETYVLRWSKQYNPEQDRINMEEEMERYGKALDGIEVLKNRDVGKVVA